MVKHWQDDAPIYRQLQDKVCQLISEGAYLEGAAVPSVRQASTELGINHLTVAKAYQGLVDKGILEKRRGLGMFVLEGARSVLIEEAKQRFFNEDIQNLADRMQRLSISTDELIAHLQALKSANQGENR